MSLTAGGFVDASENFCHYCDAKSSYSGFSVYACRECREFYTACSYDTQCPRVCLGCRGFKKVKPFDTEHHAKVWSQQLEALGKSK